MAAVRSLHIKRGFGDPFLGTSLPHRVYTGVKRSVGTAPRMLRRPITIAVLRRIIGCLQRARWLAHIDRLMTATACSLAFFGFLRCAELLSLRRSNVQLHENPTKHLTMHLEASKTDPFRHGCTLSIGSTDNAHAAICAVRLVETYLQATTAATDAPLFTCRNGQVLTRASFTSTIQRALQEDGCPDASVYKGHSFRSGAATTAAAAGVPDWLIKVMGRWSSDAYQTYVKTPQMTLLNVSCSLAKQS